MKRSPYAVAKDILQERYPKAQVSFVAGSFNRNEATDSSDIDLVVIFDKVEYAWRESFVFDEWPVEVFIHDIETLNYFFHEVDGKLGVPSLAFMVLEGKAIPENHEWNFKIKSLADMMITAKPSPWNEEIIKHQRYAITDLVDDLRAPRNEFEARIIISSLHEMLGHFYFRTKQMWSASRKYIPRRILKVNPEFGKKWIKVFDAAFLGDYNQLIELSEEILMPYGGFLFEGYRRDAPADWSLALQSYSDVLTDTKLPEIELTSDERELNHPKLGILKFRGAQISDAPQIRRLLNSAYKKLLDMGLNYNATFQDEILTVKGLKDGGSVIVVEDQSEIIATMRVKDFNQVDDRKCLYVSRFAVKPDLQNCGLGTLLLQLSENIARRGFYECIQLDTAQPAKHLVDYYQSQGFKIIQSIYFDGKTYSSWVLEKTL